MIKCALCDNEVDGDGILCHTHNWERLTAASAARIMAGTGLTYSNAAEFTQEKWVEVVREAREEAGTP